MPAIKGNSTFRTAAATRPEWVAAGVLFVTAAAAAVFLLDRARQLAVGWVDALLAGWLALSIASAAAAPNWWLATGAVGVSLAGATTFWVARALGRTRLAYLVAAGLAGACVVASGTALPP